MWEQINGVGSVLFVLVMFVVMLVITYYATKLIGKGYSAQGAGSKYIKIIDKVFIGKDMTLLIVQLAGETMLIGASSHGIQKLCDIDADKLPQILAGTGESTFLETFKNVLKNTSGWKGSDRETKEENKNGEL
ncbi:flagellar biosynthetic protein FliO [Oscillospiraceae bacterium PP1C4]